ncbi:MAG: hypothetical protein IKT98_02090 [Selenomonadaceae bacterium]|nr:hypothetical protein [Selenomonadaceae bacterium]
MTETLLSFPPEAMKTLHLAEFYEDFWKLAGESRRITKFADEEKNISQQILSQVRQENNPVRRQYLALALILFGEFQESLRLTDQNLWTSQLRDDFIIFFRWQQVLNNPLTPQRRAAFVRSEQITDFLQEKYSALTKKHSQDLINDKTCPRVKKYQIYYCWLQGEESLPPIVRCCYNSLKKNAGRYKIIFIDEKNFSKYVDIAPHIMDKFRAGKISPAHFSDVIRINLLEKYGGLWLDSTILVTEPLENHKNLLEKPFFTQRFNKEKNYRDNFSHHVTYGRWAGFIQGTSVIHNPLFTFEKEFYNEYWREYDEVIDYLLMDFMMILAYENIPAVKKEIDDIPINNTNVHNLFPRLHDSYSNFPFDKIFADTFLYKLTYKANLDWTRVGTILNEIKRRYGN